MSSCAIEVDGASIHRELSAWSERCTLAPLPCSHAMLAFPLCADQPYPCCSRTECRECAVISSTDGDWLFAQLEVQCEKDYQKRLASHRMFTGENYQRCSYISREDRRQAVCAPEPQRAPPRKENWVDEAAGEWDLEGLRSELRVDLMRTVPVDPEKFRRDGIRRHASALALESMRERDECEAAKEAAARREAEDAVIGLYSVPLQPGEGCR